MKKMICSILMFIMMSFLVSCGSKNVVEDEKITSVENNIEKDTTIDNIEDNTTVEQIEKETKTLVVYLSVTGNTEKIAQQYQIFCQQTYIEWANVISVINQMHLEATNGRD